MINLGLLIALQVIIVSVRNNGFDIDKILSNTLRVGWGIFNECGIMILVSLPYVFYFIHKGKFKFIDVKKRFCLLLVV